MGVLLGLGCQISLQGDSMFALGISMALDKLLCSFFSGRALIISHTIKMSIPQLHMFLNFLLVTFSTQGKLPLYFARGVFLTALHEEV